MVEEVEVAVIVVVGAEAFVVGADLAVVEVAEVHLTTGPLKMSSVSQKFLSIFVQ